VILLGVWCLELGNLFLEVRMVSAVFGFQFGFAFEVFKVAFSVSLPEGAE